MTTKFPELSIPSKVRWLIGVLITTCVCEVAVPGIAILMSLARHADAATDSLARMGHAVMVFDITLAACGVSAGLTAIVLLLRRKRAARAFAWISMIGLFPLLFLGVAFGVALGKLLLSEDLERYLARHAA